MKIININKYFIILTILLLIDCCLSGYIGFWREKFWSSVQHKELLNFFIYIAEFTIVAGLDCLVVSTQGYFVGILTLELRTALTKYAFELGTWNTIEGGPQRIQADCNDYYQLMLNLIGGMLRGIIMIFVFGYILLSHLNWLYIFLPVVYSLIGTGLAAWIAKPLIFLNYMNQVYEAKFRSVLEKMGKIKSSYIEVHRNNYLLYRQTKFLAYFQNFYNQITVIVPYIGLSSLYFSGKISFGIFMQTASSMIEIINNLSYLINSFNDINKWLSCRRRLKELNII